MCRMDFTAEDRCSLGARTFFETAAASLVLASAFRRAVFGTGRIGNMRSSALIYALGVAVCVGLTACGKSGSIQDLPRLDEEFQRHLLAQDNEKAADVAEHALAIVEGQAHPEDRELAKRLGDLAGSYTALGRYEAAEPLHLRSLALYEKSIGPNDTAVGGSLHSLAVHYHARGQSAKAVGYMKRALAISEKQPRSQMNFGIQAVMHSKLAEMYEAANDLNDAALHYTTAITLFESAFGSDHFQVAINERKLDRVYRRMQGR